MKTCLENIDVDDDLAENGVNDDDDHSKDSRLVYLSAVSKISEQKYNTGKPKAGRIQDSLYLFLESHYGEPVWILKATNSNGQTLYGFSLSYRHQIRCLPLDTSQKLVMENKDWHEDEALGSDG